MAATSQEELLSYKQLSSTNKTQLPSASKSCSPSMRRVIFALATLCPTVCYISRINLSLAIVAMVQESAPPTTILSTTLNNISLISDASSDIKVSGPKLAHTVTGTDSEEPKPPKSYGPKYVWSEAQIGFVNGAFFWTYVLFQIPAGRLAETLGAKWVLATAAIGSSVLSLLSPLAASLNVYAFGVLRLAMGACQTALYPAAYILYCKWLPPTERPFALSLLYAAAFFGTIVSSIATGYFCEVESLGWEYSFYFPGVLCAVWSFFWVMLATSTPRESSFISIKELEFIESSIVFESSKSQAATHTANNQMKEKQNATKQKTQSLDVGKLLSSEPIAALIYAYIASNWSMSTILLILPTYLNNVVGVSTLRNGTISAVIFALYCVSCPLIGRISTMMVETRAFGFNRLQIRKLFEAIALLGQAYCYIALPHVYGVEIILVLLSIQVVLSSFVNGGEVQVPTELSPDYSGTICALCNSAGSATGFILPAMHSAIIQDKHSRSQYKFFFYCSAAIIINNTLVFLIFGRNDIQDFSKDEDDDDETIDVVVASCM